MRVVNYKGFADSGQIDLRSGFNLLVGQNNSGKTALLEAFRFAEIASNPHKRRDLPATAVLDPQSRIELVIEFEPGDLANAALASGNYFEVPVESGHAPSGLAEAEVLMIAENPIALHLTGRMGFGGLLPSSYPSHGHFKSGGPANFVRFNPRGDKQGFDLQFLAGEQDTLCQPAFAVNQRQSFFFKAERLNVGTSAAGDATILRPDAGNLPTALAHFVGINPAAYKAYTEAVSIVLPSVKYVSSLPVGGNFELRIWTSPPTELRPDLAVPLHDSGTGVGQVLAILFVAMTMPASRIVIDEPNSFLHPGAAKKLIEILRRHDHQYIISTHSAEIISSVGHEGQIYLVQWDGYESTVERVSSSQVSDMSRALAEIGSSLADVFGADRILWVEGPTEERCFPMLINHGREGGVPPGLIVRGVIATGDLEGRKADLAWEVYRSLSTATALVPPAVGFCFDSEVRTAKEKADLRRQSQEAISFLPRRTFENYLLHPGAIAAALNDIEPPRASPVTDSAVEMWLVDRMKTDRAGHPEQYPSDEAWTINVDAPKVLRDIFREMTDATLEYRKTKHGPAIVSWLLEADPEFLQEVVVFVCDLVERGEPGGKASERDCAR